MTRGIVINSAMLSQSILQQIRKNTKTLSESANRLSSGLRINRASDDAAGLAVAESLRADRQVFLQAVRNINDGISHLHIADGAVSEMKVILLRLNELAAQSATGTLGSVQRTALNLEFQSLAEEYNRIIETTSFNGKVVFNTEHSLLRIQAGDSETGSVDLKLLADEISGGRGDVGEIRRVSVDSSGNEGTYNSTAPAVSGDGRYTVFSTRNLILGNPTDGVYLHDNITGETIFLAEGSAPDISDDGRFVTFRSGASDLVPDDTNNQWDVFLYDRLTDEITRVSVGSDGTEGNRHSSYPSISGDGRYITFTSDADNLVAGDTNGEADVFVHDRITGETTRVSVDSSGNEGNDTSGAGIFGTPTISADGRFVAFSSHSTNLVAGDNNGKRDVFVHDRATGETTRVSISSAGVEGNGDSYRASISADGRFVTFESDSNNLVGGTQNSYNQIYVHDRLTGETTRISTGNDGNPANGNSEGGRISGDGRYVVFRSAATDLVEGDTNNRQDIFVHDRRTGKTARLSVDAEGNESNGDSLEFAISSDGSTIVFESEASNLVPGDTNGLLDIFAVSNPLASNSSGYYSLFMLSGLSVLHQAEALSTLNALGAYLEELSSVGGNIGAGMARLQVSQNHLSAVTEVLTTAESRIRDVDVAEEAARYVQAQIRQQAGAAMLAQANQQASIAAKLLNF